MGGYWPTRIWVVCYQRSLRNFKSNTWTFVSISMIIATKRRLTIKCKQANNKVASTSTRTTLSFWLRGKETDWLPPFQEKATLTGKMAAIRVCSVLSALTKRHSATVCESHIPRVCVSEYWYSLRFTDWFSSSIFIFRMFRIGLAVSYPSSSTVLWNM